MGLNAQIVAIGPYSSAVGNSLEYGSTFYSDVVPGTEVITNVFIACTSDESHQLAAAFGVGAMEFGKHKLDPNKADFPRLTELFGDDDIKQFQCLAHHGFDFFYLPNA